MTTPAPGTGTEGRKALRDLMAAYERRVRSDCKTPEDLAKEPWRCAEYIAAEKALGMKLLFSDEWLRNRIHDEPENVSAGPDIAAHEAAGDRAILEQIYSVVNHKNCERNPIQKLEIIDQILLHAFSAAPVPAPRAEGEATLEASRRAHDWMVAHDQLLGWIQGNQIAMKEFLRERPHIDLPKPAPAPSLAAVREAWQPISSAPKDGTCVLVASWSDIHGWVIGTSVWYSDRGLEGWISRGLPSVDGHGPGELGLGNPSHWHPINRGLPALARLEGK